MSDELLYRIQRLQFSSRSEAEALLLQFIAETFPQLLATEVELRPLVVSLNSFNGFLTTQDGRRLFFKTHVEQDNVIGEYYNAAMLAKVGYPVIQPILSSTQSGQQLLIYEVVEHPSVFDVARALETAPALNASTFEALERAQNQSDSDLLQIYLNTLEDQTAADSVKQPIHQLFYHRLTGGRMDRFYADDIEVVLPDGKHAMREVKNVHWVINDSTYTLTIQQIAAQAVELLNPAQSQPSIVGHGDAHNGNVFFTESDLLYFDPAFAGRHHPLADLTKPLFHNVFAMWMYFAHEEREKLDISLHRSAETWHVTHNYGLNPVRRMFFESKVERTLIPILLHLKSSGQLRSDWRQYLKLLLFCCPYLTMNLTTFPPEIALLGLTMAVQMGAESESERSVIDSTLDRAADALTSQ